MGRVMTVRGVARPDLIAAVIEDARAAAARATLAVADRRQARHAAPTDALTFLLGALGSLPRAAAAAGVGASTARAVAAGRSCNPETARLIEDAAVRVAADRAAQWATGAIPAPRTAGDDVEEPPARLSRREVVVLETEHLLASGESPWQIARRLDLRLDSLRTALVRAGRVDLAERVLPGAAKTG
jgi:DNA-binding NarL/FixJ family response regulator